MTIPKNILLATDFGEVSQAALVSAFELAVALGASVHLIHALDMQHMEEATELALDAIHDAERVAQQKLDELANTWKKSGRIGRVTAHAGQPTVTILNAADEVAADLIVVGTHGRRGLSRALLGSVAESVVRQAKCPVLVVKPRLPSIATPH